MEQIYIVKNPAVDYIKQVAKKITETPSYKGISSAAFIKHTIAEIIRNNALFLISFADEEKTLITGFVMLTRRESYDGAVLMIENVWLDKKNKKGKDFFNATVEIARTLGYIKITAETIRSTKAIEKKYGFKERSRIIEYEVKGG